MRVRKSAIGSVIDMRSPARLGHARDVAVVRQLAQAQAAQPELPVDRARTPAATTARVRARGRERARALVLSCGARFAATILDVLAIQSALSMPLPDLPSASRK